MRTLIVPALALLFTSCATFTQSEMARMQASGVPAPILVKLDRGTPLTPLEIVTLSRRNVPDSYILRYLEDHGVNYLVTRQDIIQMRRGGVSAAVIDALIEECDEFARLYAAPTVGVDAGLWWVGSPYYSSDLYYDPWW